MEYHKNLSLDPIIYFDADGIEHLEVFKDVPNYEGYYQISDLGRVKSLKRNITKRDFNVLLNEKILKQSRMRGYRVVQLSISNITTSFQVHRIVSITFIENIENKNEVNHKDGVKHNNFVSNLEWTTRLENAAHALENNLYKGIKIQAFKNGVLVGEYKNLKTLSIELNINRPFISAQMKKGVELIKGYKIIKL